MKKIGRPAKHENKLIACTMRLSKESLEWLDKHEGSRGSVVERLLRLKMRKVHPEDRIRG